MAPNFSVRGLRYVAKVAAITGMDMRKLRHESRIPRDLAGIADVIGGAADA